MYIREATLADIPLMHHVRLAVKENTLTNPLAIQECDYVPFLTEKGKGWLCEMAGRTIGFAILDLQNTEVWALFVDPLFEGQGVGTSLHDTMVNWYFSQAKAELSLSTEPGTRAYAFYHLKGWVETGQKSSGEIIFKMQRKDLHLLS